MKTGKTDKNSTWTVVKNQERRRKPEDQKDSNFKNPFKYFWKWWSGTEWSATDAPQDSSNTMQQESLQQVHNTVEANEPSVTENLSHERLAPLVDKHLRKQDEELDRIGLAVKDMKEIALRMNAELSYQERIMDSLEVNVEDADHRLHGNLRRVNRI